jgi:hypothetical protein
MNLPVKFPSDTEIINEEVKRFRALSPEERMRVLCGILSAGALIMERSPNAAFLRDYTLEQENLAHEAIKEFIARHARCSGQ